MSATLKNLWILTRDFPPKSNVAAKRFAGLAPHLESWGGVRGSWLFVILRTGTGSYPVGYPCPFPKIRS